MLGDEGLSHLMLIWFGHVQQLLDGCCMGTQTRFLLCCV